MTNKFLTAILLVFISSMSFAQVKSVSYQLKFDEVNSVYDCYLVINQGNAYSKKERIQQNSQISVITPIGTNISVVKGYMPLVNNQYFEGKNPINWTVSSHLLVNDANNQANFFGISPQLSPTAHYNELNENDEIKLFSFKVSPQPNCIDEVRLFENQIDPTSQSREMKGLNFKNGFGMGGKNALYSNNVKSYNNVAATGTIPAVSPVLIGGNINLKAGDWTNAVSYHWNGPKGFSSDAKNPVIKKATLANKGIYTLTVSNAKGCSTSQEIEISVIDNNVADYQFAGEQSDDISISHANYEFRNISSSSSIYPNPATDHFNLKVDAPKGARVVVDIMDTVGKSVRSGILNETADGSVIERRINNLNLNTGIYNVSVNVNGEITSHRLIIVK